MRGAEKLSTERDRRTDGRDRERWQETDTQTGTWRQTLREQARTAKGQEIHSALSRPDHTARRDCRGDCCGCGQGRDLAGFVGRGVACRGVRAGLDAPSLFGSQGSGTLGKGGVGRGVSVADRSNPTRFSPPVPGSQTGRGKISVSDNSRPPSTESKVLLALSKSSITKLHLQSSFDFFILRQFPLVALE